MDVEKTITLRHAGDSVCAVALSRGASGGSFRYPWSTQRAMAHRRPDVLPAKM
jgi:hypothetical protein